MTDPNRPAPIIFRRRRVYAVVRSPGHALDGAVVEITGRGHGPEVHVTPLGGQNEVTLRNDEIETLPDPTPTSSTGAA